MDDTQATGTPAATPESPGSSTGAPATARPRFFRGPSGAPGRRPRFGQGRDARPRRACRFCVETKETVDYKDVPLLRSYITERGKILAGRSTGTCARHQRKIRTAIKRARTMALVPFVNK
ncbi:MAG: 30S ribosomal protein S18 [Elusimicrobia bacterium]|nr:30S ribosomal protein S18 [Elusimicrobiota bacterium]